MEPGHSYLPCDRDFGNIEKKIRGVEVFSQSNYVDIIKESRTTKPFQVVSAERENDFRCGYIAKKNELTGML